MASDWRELLGKARKAMAESREIRVPTEQVRRMANQPRVHFDQEALKRLAASMASIGQIYPGIVRAVSGEGAVKYELLDGERRWRAAKLRGLQYRALLVKADDQSASFLISAVANFNRESHTPTEVSDAIEHMLGLDMPIDEIASVLGIGVFWATQIHGLQKLAPKVRLMLDPTLPKEKLLPVTAAIQIAKVAPHLQLDLAKKVLAKKLTLRALRAEAVRVSRKAGAPIRERFIEPRYRWRSLALRASQLERVSKDVIEMVGTDPAAIIATRGSHEVGKICRQLRAAAAQCQGLAESLERGRLRTA